ncbi:MAG: hypothetical protein WCX61_05440 [Candidatus Peribacteraceae bacterium]|jgi:hypothetical protein
MKNREIGLSVCGVMVGVILGAGAILYSADPGVRANLVGELIGPVTTFRGLDIDFDRRFTRRGVAELDKQTRSSAEIIDEARYPIYPQPVVIEEEEPAVLESEECRTKRELKEKVLALVPDTATYERIKERLVAVFQEATNDCPVVHTAAPVRAKAQPTKRSR